MANSNSLIDAAHKAISNAYTLLDNDQTPFNVMYKQYKTLQSFWFRVIEDASDSNSGRLEELCIDLEQVLQECEQWIKNNSAKAKEASVQKDDAQENT